MDDRKIGECGHPHVVAYICTNCGWTFVCRDCHAVVRVLRSADKRCHCGETPGYDPSNPPSVTARALRDLHSERAMLLEKYGIKAGG